MTLVVWVLSLPFRLLAAIGLRRSVILACLFVLAVTTYGVAQDLGLVDPPGGASTVVLAVEVIGGELADLAFRVRRTVRAEDPTDLASPLHYAVEVLPDDSDDDGPAAALKPSRRWVLQALLDGGAMQSVAQLGDRTATDGHQLKARTIQEALNDLEAAGLAMGTDPGAGLARYWSPADPDGCPVDGADRCDP